MIKPRLAKPVTQLQLSSAVVVSLLALVVSVVSAFQTRQFARDTARTAMIQQAYSVFRDLTQTQVANPECSHVFVPGPLYPATTLLVRRAVADHTPAELAVIRLREGAIALRIFTHFEEAFYERKQANAAGDTARVAFLDEVLGYFTGRLLRNPRLLWYWSEAGGNLALYFETETRAYYASKVVNDGVNPLRERPDPTGPLSVPAPVQTTTGTLH